jgi:pyruvyl transferase EpsO
MTFNEKVTQLSEIINEKLLPVIHKNGKVKECIYLDLPYYTNIGDTLIWRGDEHFLNRNGLKCLYKASYQTYSERRMKKITRRRNTPPCKKMSIFLQGGGNFGDLYENHQNLRKEIIKNYPNNQIIILPQTVFYNDESKMKTDAELFAKHKNLTICARDKKSEQILKDNFHNEVILVPDMAFCIPQKELRKYAVPEISGSTLLLKRADKELDNSVDYSRYISQKRFDTCDWITMKNDCKAEKVLDRLINSKKIPKVVADLYAQKVFQKTMIHEGVKQISKYENIYSTRLHAAILSVLLEKPFVFFDNSYGKNSGFFETWLSDLDNMKFIKIMGKIKEMESVKKMSKKISVIVPIYNAEKYLRQTLNSIRFQTHDNLEIICVLDCPTDNSAAIVEELAKEDGRINPVRHSENMGLPGARNTGVQNATGEYMHFIDADDLVNPEFYKALIDAATAADADVAACSVFYEKKPKQSFWFLKDEVLTGQKKITKTAVIMQGWAWRYLIRRKFWNDYNLSFPNLVPMEDSPVMIPMVYYANKIAFCPNAVYFYKNRPGSLINLEENSTGEKEKWRIENRQKAEDSFHEFMRCHNIKRHNKIYSKRYRLAGYMTCENDLFEYGKTDKKISVVVPVYNAEKYLKQTLDAIRFQTYRNLEIICVLDCPTDSSAAIVEQAAKEDARVRPVWHQMNLGLPAARNTGVYNATGEYIHFIDSDDLISPDFYEIMASAAVDTGADVAACSVFYEKKQWRSIWFRKSEVLSGPAKIEKTEVAILGWAWRYLIRRSFWNSHNFSFPELVPMEDMPVMIPMIYHANKVALCPSAVYFYKHRKSSILNKNYNPERKKLYSENRRKARKIFRDFMRVNNIKRPNRLSYYLEKRFA